MTLSTVTVRGAEEAETLPQASVAFAVCWWAPTSVPVGVLDHWPLASAVTVPCEAAPSMSLTMMLGSGGRLVGRYGRLSVPVEGRGRGPPAGCGGRRR